MSIVKANNQKSHHAVSSNDFQELDKLLKMYDRQEAWQLFDDVLMLLSTAELKHEHLQEARRDVSAQMYMWREAFKAED